MTTSIRFFQKPSSSNIINLSNTGKGLPDQILQRKSDESNITRVFSQGTDDIQMQRPQAYSIPTTILVDPSKSTGEKSVLTLWQKKLKKIKKKKNPFDYRKNICGYITKKVIREFTSAQYRQKAEELCEKYKCDYNQSKLYYSSKIQYVTGPSHIPGLLIPEQKSQTEFKLVFRDFFQWFLRQHYLRYLLIEGKMADKKAYIDYKNNTLLNMVNPKNIKYYAKFQHSNKKRQYKKQQMDPQIPILKIEPIIKIEPGMQQDQ